MRRLLLGFAGLLVAACGAQAVIHTTPAAALKLRFTPGQTITYDLHLKQNLMSGSFPINSDLTGTEVMKVLSVAPDGTATVDVTARITSGTVNGKSLGGSIPPARTIEMKIAPDGRVVGANGAAISSGLSSLSGSQLTSLLPPGKVKPGDRWTRDTTQPNPFGTGDLAVHSSNEFLRYQTIAGISYSVVSTTATVPMNLTIDFAKLAALLGGGGAKLPAGSATLAGSVTSHITTWIDPASGQFHEMDNVSDMNITMTIPGAPQPVAISGTQSFTLIGK